MYITDGMTTHEMKIVQSFLEGTPIRKLSEENPGYGRTAINNIIEKFASKSEENANAISERKLMNRTHKTKKGVSEYSRRGNC
mgnify:CR=1 FL=1